MILVLKIFGWILRACALICIVFITVGAARGHYALNSASRLLASLAWHAAFAMGGVQAVGWARRLEQSRSAVQVAVKCP